MDKKVFDAIFSAPFRSSKYYSLHQLSDLWIAKSGKAKKFLEIAAAQEQPRNFKKFKVAALKDYKQAADAG